MKSNSDDMRSRVESELFKWKQLLQKRNIDLTK